MNRSTGAYAPLTFLDFCIGVRLASGGVYFEKVRETSSKRALGKVFGGLRADGIEPAAEKAVAMCKTPDRMTFDERGEWDVLTAEDRVRMAREDAERRAYWSGMPEL